MSAPNWQPDPPHHGSSDVPRMEATNGPYLAYRPETNPQPQQSPPSGQMPGQGPGYSEADSNPLPQIMMGDAMPEVAPSPMPEVVGSPPPVYPDVVRADFVKESAASPMAADGRSQETNVDTSKPQPWYKKRSFKLAAIIALVSTVLILAIVFGTLGGLGVLSNNRSTAAASANQTTTTSGDPNSSTSPPASSSPTTTTPTTSSATTSRTSHPTMSVLPQCAQYSQFLTNMSFVSGNVRPHGVGFTLPYTLSLEDCCAICYQKSADGCNMWVWNPEDHPIVPCTIILGYLGDNPDKQCPYGHTNSSDFSVQLGGNGTGFHGPCGEGQGTIVPGSGRKRHEGMVELGGVMTGWW